MEKTDATPVAKGTPGSALTILIGPLLIILLAVYFFVLAGSLDQNPMEGQLGAAFWPRTILILLMLGCVLKAYELLQSRGKFEPTLAEGGPLPEVNRPKLIAMIVMILGVVFFLDTIGFALANFIFLLIFMRIAGVRKMLPLILTSVLGTIFLLYLFVKVVYLPLPKGIWVFTDLTIFIYRALFII